MPARPFSDAHVVQIAMFHDASCNKYGWGVCKSLRTSERAAEIVNLQLVRHGRRKTAQSGTLGRY